MSTAYILMKIKEVRQETPDAVSILLEYPLADREKLQFKPGQFITVIWMDGEREIRRSYSISSIPEDPYLSITVKEVKKGLISPLLCRQLKPGDMLKVLPPEGRFTAEYHPDHKRNIYLIGAGSGITPLMSIGRFVLEKEPKSTVVLLYGNRSESDIIFRDELEKMTKRYQNQFYIYHSLSKPEGEGLGIVKSLFGRKKPEWEGFKGRINPARIKELLKLHPATRKNDLYFLCGPGNFILMSEKALMEEGIMEESIKKEFFTPASSDPAHPAKSPGIRPKGHPAKVTAHLRGQTIEVDVMDKTILDTLLDQGYDAPYSCHSGACATCMAKIISGKVEMDACFALSDKEVENGYVLTCQSRPLTETVELSYED